jgi:hypothetical protein
MLMSIYNIKQLLLDTTYTGVVNLLLARVVCPGWFSIVSFIKLLF